MDSLPSSPVTQFSPMTLKIRVFFVFVFKKKVAHDLTNLLDDSGELTSVTNSRAAQWLISECRFEAVPKTCLLGYLVILKWLLEWR